jgi:hypothetical protein
MDPVIDYEELVSRLTNAFKNRYDVVGHDDVRMVGIVFASPNSPLAGSEIIPRIADWHHRSGDHIDFFFAGYTYPHPPVHGYISVPVPGQQDWLYSPRLFNRFREEIESRTKWRYSGACDLLLLNSRFDGHDEIAEVDFDSAIVCQLDSMKEDKAIKSVEQFFETIFRFAQSASGKDPTWGFSDKQGVRVAGSALKRVALSFLPKGLDEDIKKAEHFAVQAIGREADGV